MARKQCRLWWPRNLLCREPSSDLLLFGWYIHSSNSVDVVVAVAIAVDEISLHPPHSDLQEILHSINLNMPMALQESSTFSILGRCAVQCTNQDMKTMCNQSSDSLSKNMQGEEEEENTTGKCDNVTLKCREKTAAGVTSTEYCGNCDCACEKLNQFIEPHREVMIRRGNWIQLRTKFQGIKCKETRWIPDFHHMHQNGHIQSISDVHMIIYEPPTYGRHHFHLSSWGYSEESVPPFKKPNWYHDLHQNLLLPNLEAVLLALNCASAALLFSGRHFTTTGSGSHFKFISRFVYALWYMLAASLASISTVTYFALQFFHRLVSFGSHTFFFILLRMLFVHTWNNVHIRSCQFLYWPMLLLGSGFRAQSNVEYAHRAALRKHFMWSSVAMDVTLGIVFGVAVLLNIEAVFLRILFIARYITDNLLRSGCVWLMGGPAGFKLNTELVELLGMVSLNAIQIFSTSGFFMASIFKHAIRGLAVCGIVFGLTIPAALCIDMLRLATLHIWTLHCFMSFLYSQQIQALASLWRLFRGRKWNPLRQRLDSYDYSVEQHVVGSLLFTPFLLLLPTTSVFYMFFTILNTTISSICIMIEITISVLHATPYAEILLWVVRTRRFPSGIWFEIMSGQPVFPSTSRRSNPRNASNFINMEPESVVSLLHSNYASIRQIVAPHYKNLLKMNPFLGFPSAYEILSGQRIPATLQVNLPPTLPWMHVSCRQYWRFCLNSVLACRSSP